jgi:hypothetical protein
VQEEARPEAPPAKSPPRTSKLFQVLVIGGALLAAAACATAATHGEMGSAQDSSDGGVPGW